MDFGILGFWIFGFLDFGFWDFFDLWILDCQRLFLTTKNAKDIFWQLRTPRHFFEIGDFGRGNQAAEARVTRPGPVPRGTRGRDTPLQFTGCFGT